MEETNSREKRRKGLLVALAAVMVCALSVAGTVAFMAKKTDPVINTFVAGQIGKLQLLEHELGASGNLTDTVIEANKMTYQLTAGTDIPKDTFTQVSELTVPAYVFVAVNDELADFATYTMSNKWQPVNDGSGDVTFTTQTEVTVDDGTGGTTTKTVEEIWKVYAYESIVPATGATGTWTADLLNPEYLIVADNFEGLDTSKTPNLDFRAYMCQAAGFDNAYDAWKDVSANHNWQTLS